MLENVSKFYSKYHIELSCIWSIKFFNFRKRYNLVLCGMNSLSRIFDLTVDISVLIFQRWTQTIDWHLLTTISKKTFEKIRRPNKKHTRKFIFFYVDTSALDKKYFRLLHPSKNISNPPSFLEFEKSIPSSFTTTTFKREYCLRHTSIQTILKVVSATVLLVSF